jgi:hypothetical protein
LSFRAPEFGARNLLFRSSSKSRSLAPPPQHAQQAAHAGAPVPLGMTTLEMSQRCQASVWNPQ